MADESALYAIPHLWFLMVSTFLKTFPHTSQTAGAWSSPLCVRSWISRLYCLWNERWQKRHSYESVWAFRGFRGLRR